MRMATWLRRFTDARPPGRSAKPPPPGAEPSRRASRERNLFEAAAAHVAASVEGDEEAVEAASARVAPEALMFGISELARRAVVVLAQERGVPPRVVARSLLGLPEV
ncbi:hypothetical protein ACFZAU_00290 [Streptomyces sp. NPDC008238]